jgi:hypothetical protein
MVDQRQAELALAGETVSPRALWEAYKRNNPEWREAWWRSTIRASFKNILRLPDAGAEPEAGWMWSIPLSVPWNIETDTPAEPAAIDVPMDRRAALKIARRMPLIEVINSPAQTDHRFGWDFHWEREPGNIFSSWIVGAIERDRVPHTGPPKFSRIVGVTFFSELLRGTNWEDMPEDQLLKITGGDLSRLGEDVSPLTPQELAQFWADLDVFLKPAGEVHPIEQEPKKSMETLGTAKKTAFRWLPEGSTLVDREVYHLAQELAGAKGIPRSWLGPHWVDLQEEEVRRVYAELGEAAIKHGRLKRAREDGSLHLTESARAALRERISRTGAFREDRSEAGGDREYLVRRFVYEKGWYELGISSYIVEILDQGAREEARQQATNRIASIDANPYLIPGDQKRAMIDRGKAQNKLRLLGTLDDAGVIFKDLIGRLGAEGALNISIPSEELRSLLGYESAPHGLQRVEGALDVLQNLTCHLDADGERPVRGSMSLVADWIFEGEGPGKHSDGDYMITLGYPAMRTLRAFKHPTAQGEFILDFKRPIKRERVEHLDYYHFDVRPSTIERFANIAGLDKHQKHILAWISANTTRNKDRARKGRKGLQVKDAAPNAMEKRIYTTDFCPLLPPGEYIGVLGRGNRNGAERGFKLATFIKEMARNPKPVDAPAAIADLVQRALAGHIAIYYRALWWKAEHIKGQPDAEANGLWFLFLPKGWVGALRASIEDVTHYRFQEDLKRYQIEKGKDQLPHGTAPIASGPNDPVSPLWARMKKGRTEKGLSQAQLATALGVPQPKVSGWESNRKPIPASQVQKIEAWLAEIYPS